VDLRFTSFNLAGFNLDTEIKAQLEQQLKENVLLGAVGLEVLYGGFKGFGDLVAVWVPLQDVCGVQLEDAEAEVAREQRIFLFDFLSGAAQALFG
jgi:hypothetical protein